MSMNEKFKAQLEADGHTVIEAKCVVFDDGATVHGVDDKGEPIENTGVDINANPVTPYVIIPKSRTGKLYFGETKTVVKNKMLANMPDIEKKEETDGKVIKSNSVCSDLSDAN